FEKRNAAKRGGGNTALCLDELAECIADAGDVEKHVEMSELARALNAWLEGLETEKRVIFVRRYWHMDGIADIAAALDLGESNVKVTLHRLRGELKEYLTKEGFEI
ncbi:MAG: sigma-70 family RNA polymerase sigma factor, partial [Firmicutes bacterium]|nr:sigma-70 family RNA polymerase sigma factor [Bacillota bacterium]